MDTRTAFVSPNVDVLEDLRTLDRLGPTDIARVLSNELAPTGRLSAVRFGKYVQFAPDFSSGRLAYPPYQGHTPQEKWCDHAIPRYRATETASGGATAGAT